MSVNSVALSRPLVIFLLVTSIFGAIHRFIVTQWSFGLLHLAVVVLALDWLAWHRLVVRAPKAAS